MTNDREFQNSNENNEGARGTNFKNNSVKLLSSLPTKNENCAIEIRF